MQVFNIESTFNEVVQMFSNNFRNLKKLEYFISYVENKIIFELIS